MPESEPSAPALRWWQRALIYQVYPRSFQDSNGDGVGDLQGILQRLDYLQQNHVSTLWLSPIYPSPMVDFGYDVADYTGIHPLFGTLADFDALLAAVHQRNMRLVLDLVPNHTSDQHLWFQESRSSRANPKRDWYIWRDPAPGGGPPNNWLSFFGGPAWTLDPATGQYYLHQFVPEQPELNYRNPAVLQAMLGEMRFWLDRGVDGFRVDVMWLMIKDEQLRDEPPNPEWREGQDPIGSLLHLYSADQPEVHDLVRAMRDLLASYGAGERERLLVGEIYLPNQQLVQYYGAQDDECHLPFNFQLIRAPWDAATVRTLVDEYEAALPAHGWPNWVLGNHDQRRLATRVGPQQLRVATMLLLTLRGTPTCYYGDEIGMHNVPIPLDQLRDPPAVNMPHLADIVGRDPVRTPMQWDASPNAGFCAAGVTPWLPLAADFAENNVALQERDPHSMLSYFRALAGLRSRSETLLGGDYRSIETGAADLFCYVRSAGDEQLLVVLNFGGEPQRMDLSALAAGATILLETNMVQAGPVALDALAVAPNQGLLLRLE